MYQPSAEQAEKDRLAAYEAGVPHGKLTAKLTDDCTAEVSPT